ncbi:hypothetical protein ACWDF9_08695 [Streptomyces rubiginosohelvolus]
MATTTVFMPPVTLPVRLVIGDSAIEIGEVTLEPGDDGARLVASTTELLRGVVEELENPSEDDEGDDDAAP